MKHIFSQVKNSVVNFVMMMMNTMVMMMMMVVMNKRPISVSQLKHIFSQVNNSLANFNIDDDDPGGRDIDNGEYDDG